MTVKQLQDFIRRQTIEANERLDTYKYEYVQSNKGLTDFITKLKEKGTGNTQRDYIGLGFRGKRKEDLQAQARELEYFNEWDYASKKASEERRQQEDKAWKSFRKTHKSWTRDEWGQTLKFFANISPTILEQFGSEEAMELYQNAKDRDIDEMTFGDILKDASMQASDENWSDEEMVDFIWDKINEYEEI